MVGGQEDLLLDLALGDEGVTDRRAARSPCLVTRPKTRKMNDYGERHRRPYPHDGPLDAPTGTSPARHVATAGRRNHGLKQNSLGVPSIFFYIIAAASPLTVVVALFPIIIGSGNGVGMPGAFVIAAVVLMIFAVGYVAMSRHVTNAGAFYAYVTLGLGRIAGLGSAFLAIFAYNAIQAGLYGGFGYYAAELINPRLGVDVPWWASPSSACWCAWASACRACTPARRCSAVLHDAGGHHDHHPQRVQPVR